CPARGGAGAGSRGGPAPPRAAAAAGGGGRGGGPPPPPPRGPARPPPSGCRGGNPAGAPARGRPPHRARFTGAADYASVVRRCSRAAPRKAYARLWGHPSGMLTRASIRVPGPCARERSETALAPRVLLDATAVPADRGASGRYVDGVVAALGSAGADLAVACQRADEERYGRLVPGARIAAGPTAIAHRPARLAWEQTGLPLVAQQVGANVLHVPHYS